MKFLDVCPLDLGIATIGDVFSPIINRNSRIPCEKVKDYYTTQDNQKSVKIEIYQGSSEKASMNTKLGEFNLNNLPLRPARQVTIDVVFKLDSNSILECYATVRDNKNIKNSARVDLAKNASLSVAEVEQGTQQHAKFEEYAKSKKEKLTKLTYLEGRLSEITEGLSGKADGLSPSIVQQVTEYVESTNSWVISKKNNIYDVNLNEILERISQLEQICLPARLNKN